VTEARQMKRAPQVACGPSKALVVDLK
jgi:hypothetical protein